MRVLFFDTNNFTPHLETSFELAKQHLDKGDDVYYFFLGHSLPFVEFLKTKKTKIFSGCLPERKAAKLLGKRLIFKEASIFVRDYDSVVGRKFESIKDLREFKYKNYNAGLSALSSLVSHLKLSDPNLKNFEDLVKKILSSGIAVYEYVLAEIDKQQPDLIYLFNGRFAVNRAILDAAIEKKIPFLIHERGANKTKYSVQPWMPHDFERVKDSMLATWVKSDKCERVDIGKKFFQDRRNGLEQGWKSYTAMQSKNSLPKIVAGKKVIVYFSSSEDEYVAVGDIVKWKYWPNQLTAVGNLVELTSKYTAIHLIIRLHPHKAEKHPLDLEKWCGLGLPENAELILPTESVDTYALIDRADLVITCGSTTGIESVYWGTPSVCLGPSIYSHLDAVYLPESVAELERLLLSDSVIADPNKALPYGYYMASHGEPFSYYQAETLFSGKFMKVNLQPHGICKVLRVYVSFIVRILKKATYFGRKVLN